MERPEAPRYSHRMVRLTGLTAFFMDGITRIDKYRKERSWT
jgi:hypothetical protein